MFSVLLLVIAVVAIVYSIALLRRAGRDERQARRDDIRPTSTAAASAFLNSRGRRYGWYLLIVSSFLAFLIIKNFISHYA